MAYWIGYDMHITDYAVRCAIIELQYRKTISHEDIAVHIGCGRKAVWAACRRLMEAGIVTRQGSKRYGYKYVVHPEFRLRRSNHAEKEEKGWNSQEKAVGCKEVTA